MIAPCKKLKTLAPCPMTKLDNIFKSKDIILPTKIHLVKAMMLSNCGVGEDSWESLGLQGDKAS